MHQPFVSHAATLLACLLHVRAVDSPACKAGACPVMLKGAQLDKLIDSTDPDASNADVLCWFGDDLPCSSVPTNIRSDEVACATPTLPASHGIVPFGVLVLGAGGVPPGTLYRPVGLELTFFDSAQPPIVLRIMAPLHPSSDIVDVPQRVTVVGKNFGPGRSGVPQPIQCQWGGEQPVPGVQTEGKYKPEEQTLGDDESHIDCPGPIGPPVTNPLTGLVTAGSYRPGDYVFLRVSLRGPASAEADYSTSPGARLVFFDARQKVRLFGFHST